MSGAMRPQREAHAVAVGGAAALYRREEAAEQSPAALLQVHGGGGLQVGHSLTHSLKQSESNPPNLPLICRQESRTEPKRQQYTYVHPESQFTRS